MRQKQLDQNHKGRVRDNRSARPTEAVTGVGMVEKFIVVWTIDGETMSVPHSTQDEALQQAKELLREYGCEMEIALHLNQISPPPSIWFNKTRMRNWCLAGFPAVQI
jgi:hypothetical protein